MLLNATMELHDVTDTEKFCRRIIENREHKTPGTYLTDTDRDDLLTYLIDTAWTLSTRYNPERNSSFSKYAYSTLSLRCTDWIRTRQGRTKWTFSTHTYTRERPTVISIDDDDASNVTTPDRGEHDSLGFTVRTLAGDPTISCDPALANVLARGSRGETPGLHLRDPVVDGRPPNRNRKLAA